MNLRLPLPLLVAFVLGVFVGSPFAQEPIQGPYVMNAASTPLPSSVRLTGDKQPNDPGVEGQISISTNYLYTFHDNFWKRTPRILIN